MATFAERLIQIMKIRDIKAIELSEKTGISRSQISEYVHGKCEPKRAKLEILAQALDVSDAWLCGYDKPMERKTTPSGKTTENDIKVALFGGDNEVTDEQWAEVLSYVEFVKQKNKEKNK